MTADEIIEGIKRLWIIDISIDHSDNPQLIFESINSTGLDLTEGDKIRNFVLMDIENKKQSLFYSKYWKKIEEFTSRNDNTDGVGLFIRDFLTCITAKTPNLNEIYIDFKKFCTETGTLEQDREVLFAQLLKYAQNYHYLLFPENLKNKLIAQGISRINKQEISPSYSFFLEILTLWADEKLTDKQVIEIFKIIDTFVFRRQMCDLPSNSLNKIFNELHKSITKLNSNTPYEDRLKWVLLTKTGKARFPSNLEFRQAMIDKRVYEMRSKNRAYLFARLENGESLDAPISGSRDLIYDKIADKSYTIEHIMPQTLNIAWKKELGEHWDEIHEKWLHRLGNLTLTAYNSQLSNKSFKSKTGRNLQQFIEEDFGFASSAHHLWLNENLAKQNNWTEVEIKARAEMIAEKALLLWPMFVTSFQKELSRQAFSLRKSAPDIFTGSKPLEFVIDNHISQVETWVDLYVQCVSYFYNLDPTPIDELTRSSENKGIATFFSSRKAIRFKFIAKNVYLSTGTSTSEKQRVLIGLLDLYKMEDINIYIEHKDLDIEDDEDCEDEIINSNNDNN